MSGRKSRKSQKLGSSRRNLNRTQNRDAEEKERDYVNPETGYEEHEQQIDPHAINENPPNDVSLILQSDHAKTAGISLQTSATELHIQSQDGKDLLALAEAVSKKRKMGSTRKSRGFKGGEIPEEEPAHNVEECDWISEEHRETKEVSVEERRSKEDKGQHTISDYSSWQPTKAVSFTLHSEPIGVSSHEPEQLAGAAFCAKSTIYSCHFSVVRPTEDTIPSLETSTSLQMYQQVEAFSNTTGLNEKEGSDDRSFPEVCNPDEQKIISISANVNDFIKDNQMPQAAQIHSGINQTSFNIMGHDCELTFTTQDHSAKEEVCKVPLFRNEQQYFTRDGKEYIQEEWQNMDISDHWLKNKIDPIPKDVECIHELRKSEHMKDKGEHIEEEHLVKERDELKDVVEVEYAVQSTEPDEINAMSPIQKNLEDTPLKRSLDLPCDSSSSEMQPLSRARHLKGESSVWENTEETEKTIIPSVVEIKETNMKYMQVYNLTHNNSGELSFELDTQRKEEGYSQQETRFYAETSPKLNDEERGCAIAENKNQNCFEEIRSSKTTTDTSALSIREEKKNTDNVKDSDETFELVKTNINITQRMDISTENRIFPVYGCLEGESKDKVHSAEALTTDPKMKPVEIIALSEAEQQQPGSSHTEENVTCKHLEEQEEKGVEQFLSSFAKEHETNKDNAEQTSLEKYRTGSQANSGNTGDTTQHLSKEQFKAVDCTEVMTAYLINSNTDLTEHTFKTSSCFSQENWIDSFSTLKKSTEERKEHELDDETENGGAIKSQEVSQEDEETQITFYMCEVNKCKEQDCSAKPDCDIFHTEGMSKTPVMISNVIVQTESVVLNEKIKAKTLLEIEKQEEIVIDDEKGNHLTASNYHTIPQNITELPNDAATFDDSSQEMSLVVDEYDKRNTGSESPSQVHACLTSGLMNVISETNKSADISVDAENSHDITANQSGQLPCDHNRSEDYLKRKTEKESESTSSLIHSQKSKTAEDNVIPEKSELSSSGKRRKSSPTRRCQREQCSIIDSVKINKKEENLDETDNDYIAGSSYAKQLTEEEPMEAKDQQNTSPTEKPSSGDSTGVGSEQHVLSESSSQTAELSLSTNTQPSPVRGGNVYENVDMKITELHSQSQSAKKKKFGSTRRPKRGYRTDNEGDERKWENTEAPKKTEHDVEKSSKETTYNEVTIDVLTESQSDVSGMSLSMLDQTLEKEFVESTDETGNCERVKMPPVALLSVIVHSIDHEEKEAEGLLKNIESQDKDVLDKEKTDDSKSSDEPKMPLITTNIQKELSTFSDHHHESSMIVEECHLEKSESSLIHIHESNMIQDSMPIYENSELNTSGKRRKIGSTQRNHREQLHGGDKKKRSEREHLGDINDKETANGKLNQVTASSTSGTVIIPKPIDREEKYRAWKDSEATEEIEHDMEVRCSTDTTLDECPKDPLIESKNGVNKAEVLVENSEAHAKVEDGHIDHSETTDEQKIPLDDTSAEQDISQETSIVVVDHDEENSKNVVNASLTSVPFDIITEMMKNEVEEREGKDTEVAEQPEFIVDEKYSNETTHHEVSTDLLTESQSNVRGLSLSMLDPPLEEGSVVSMDEAGKWEMIDISSVALINVDHDLNKAVGLEKITEAEEKTALEEEKMDVSKSTQINSEIQENNSTVYGSLQERPKVVEECNVENIENGSLNHVHASPTSETIDVIAKAPYGLDIAETTTKCHEMISDQPGELPWDHDRSKKHLEKKTERESDSTISLIHTQESVQKDEKTDDSKFSDEQKTTLISTKIQNETFTFHVSHDKRSFAVEDSCSSQKESIEESPWDHNRFKDKASNSTSALIHKQESNKTEDNVITEYSELSTSGTRRKIGSTRRSHRERLHGGDKERMNEEKNRGEKDDEGDSLYLADNSDISAVKIVAEEESMEAKEEISASPTDVPIAQDLSAVCSEHVLSESSSQTAELTLTFSTEPSPVSKHSDSKTDDGNDLENVEMKITELHPQSQSKKKNKLGSTRRPRRGYRSDNEGDERKWIDTEATEEIEHDVEERCSTDPTLDECPKDLQTESQNEVNKAEVLVENSEAHGKLVQENRQIDHTETTDEQKMPLVTTHMPNDTSGEQDFSQETCMVVEDHDEENSENVGPKQVNASLTSVPIEIVTEMIENEEEEREGKEKETAEQSEFIVDEKYSNETTHHEVSTDLLTESQSDARGLSLSMLDPPLEEESVVSMDEAGKWEMIDISSVALIDVDHYLNKAVGLVTITKAQGKPALEDEKKDGSKSTQINSEIQKDNFTFYGSPQKESIAVEECNLENNENGSLNHVHASLTIDKVDVITEAHDGLDIAEITTKCHEITSDQSEELPWDHNRSKIHLEKPTDRDSESTSALIHTQESCTTEDDVITKDLQQSITGKRRKIGSTRRSHREQLHGGDKKKINEKIDGKERYGEENDLDLTDRSEVSASSSAEKPTEEMSMDPKPCCLEQHDSSDLCSQKAELSLTSFTQPSPVSERSVSIKENVNDLENVEITKLQPQSQSTKKKKFGSTRRPRRGYRSDNEGDERKWIDTEATKEIEHDVEERCSTDTTCDEHPKDLLTESQNEVNKAEVLVDNSEAHGKLVQENEQIDHTETTDEQKMPLVTTHMPNDTSGEQDFSQETCMVVKGHDEENSENVSPKQVNASLTSVPIEIVTEMIENEEEEREGKEKEAAEQSEFIVDEKYSNETTHHEVSTDLLTESQSDARGLSLSMLDPPLEEESVVSMDEAGNWEMIDISSVALIDVDHYLNKAVGLVTITKAQGKPALEDEKKDGSKSTQIDSEIQKDNFTFYGSPQKESIAVEECNLENNENGSLNHVHASLTIDKVDVITEAHDGLDIAEITTKCHEITSDQSEELPWDHNRSKIHQEKPTDRDSESTSALIHTQESCTTEDDVITKDSQQSITGKRRKIGSTRRSHREQLHGGDKKKINEKIDGKERYGEENDLDLTDRSEVSASSSAEKPTEEMSMEPKPCCLEQHDSSDLCSQKAELSLTSFTQPSPVSERSVSIKENVNDLENVDITKLQPQSQSTKKKKFGSTRRPRRGYRPDNEGDEIKWKNLEATEEMEDNVEGRCSEETTYHTVCIDPLDKSQSDVSGLSLPDPALKEKTAETSGKMVASERTDMPSIASLDFIVHSMDREVKKAEVGVITEAPDGLDIPEITKYCHEITSDQSEELPWDHRRIEERASNSTSALIHTQESNMTENNVITEYSELSTSGKKRKIGSTRRSHRERLHGGYKERINEEENGKDDEVRHEMMNSDISAVKIVAEEESMAAKEEISASPTDVTIAQILPAVCSEHVLSESSSQTPELTLTPNTEPSPVSEHSDSKTDDGKDLENVEMKITELHPQSQSKKKNKLGSTRRPQRGYRPDNEGDERKWIDTEATEEIEHDVEERRSKDTAQHKVADLLSVSLSKVSELITLTGECRQIGTPNVTSSIKINSELIIKDEKIDDSKEFHLQDSTIQGNIKTENSELSKSGKRRKMGSTRRNPRERRLRDDQDNTLEELEEEDTIKEQVLKESTPVTLETSLEAETLKNIIPTFNAETSHLPIPISVPVEPVNIVTPKVKTKDEKKRKIGSTRRNFKGGDIGMPLEEIEGMEPQADEHIVSGEIKPTEKEHTLLDDTTTGWEITAKETVKENEPQIHPMFDKSECSLLSEIECELKMCGQLKPIAPATCNAPKESSLNNVVCQYNLSKNPEAELCRSNLELATSQNSQTLTEISSPARRRKLGSTRKTPRNKQTEELKEEGLKAELQAEILDKVELEKDKAEDNHALTMKDMKASVIDSSQFAHNTSESTELPPQGGKKKFGSRRAAKGSRNLRGLPSDEFCSNQEKTENILADELTVCDPYLTSRPQSSPFSQTVSEHNIQRGELVKNLDVKKTDVTSEAGLVSLNDLINSALYNGNSGEREKIDFEKWSKQIPDFGEAVYNVVMVGNSNVGKTSFMNRLQSGQFSPDYSSTIGVDTCVQIIALGSRTVKLHVWDTAGQERYHSITRQIFHKAQGLLLMYDITSLESFYAIRNWISQIKECAPDDVIMMLLGNKSDCAERKVHLQQGEDLSREYKIHFLECSAATGENVTESMKTLACLLVKQNVRREDRTIPQSKQPQQKSGCC